MLKRLENITIRDYSLFEQSNDLRYLLKWKHTPMFLVRKTDVETLLTGIFEQLTEKDDAKRNLRREFHRLKSMSRIKLLIALQQAVSNLFNKIQVNRWKQELGKKTDDVKNLQEYIEKIHAATGIEIKHPSDLEKLTKEITRWVDKYRETFEAKKKENDNELTFMQVVLGVFAAMNMSLNYDMYLSDFFLLKKEAERMAKLRNETMKR